MVFWWLPQCNSVEKTFRQPSPNLPPRDPQTSPKGNERKMKGKWKGNERKMKGKWIGKGSGEDRDRKWKENERKMKGKWKGNEREMNKERLRGGQGQCLGIPWGRVWGRLPKRFFQQNYIGATTKKPPDKPRKYNRITLGQPSLMRGLSGGFLVVALM